MARWNRRPLYVAGHCRVVVLGSTLLPDVAPPDGVTCTLDADGNLTCFVVICGNSPLVLLGLAFAFAPVPFTGIDGWLLLWAASAGAHRRRMAGGVGPPRR